LSCRIGQRKYAIFFEVNALCGEPAMMTLLKKTIRSHQCGQTLDKTLASRPRSWVSPQRIASRAVTLFASDLKHVELADQGTKDDRAIAGIAVEP
jgi:hypothetical protein